MVVLRERMSTLQKKFNSELNFLPSGTLTVKNICLANNDLGNAPRCSWRKSRRWIDRPATSSKSLPEIEFLKNYFKVVCFCTKVQKNAVALVQYCMYCYWCYFSVKLFTLLQEESMGVNKSLCISNTLPDRTQWGPVRNEHVSIRNNSVDGYENNKAHGRYLAAVNTF